MPDTQSPPDNTHADSVVVETDGVGEPKSDTIAGAERDNDTPAVEPKNNTKKPDRNIYFPGDPEFEEARKKITPAMASSLDKLRADFKFLEVSGDE